MAKYIITGENCQPCKALKEKFAKAIEDGELFLIDAQNNRPLLTALGIKMVPTLLEVTSGFDSILEKLK